QMIRRSCFPTVLCFTARYLVFEVAVGSQLHYFSSPLPARPYSLSINAEDYHYAPKPKHLRPARLLRILGPSFDPFWMSIEPEDVLPRDVAAAVRAWLVRSATCALRYKWVDLGPVFWPRWLRHTDCDQPGRVQSCSFPAGMACRRAQVTQIKILAWHCWGSEDRGVEAAGVADLGLAMYGKRCVWRQVPYPVVTACKCSCK
uniref:Noggin n=1 Tax=Scleropages formosus TaxID=113540 RepID=A0A8C9RNA6_SCLFO